MSSDALSSPKDLHRGGVYRAAKTVDQLKEELELLRALDKESEEEIAKWRSYGNIGIVIMVAVLIIFLVVAVAMEGSSSVACVLGIPAFIAGIVLKVKASTRVKAAEKHEFPDYRYVSSYGLLNLLGADTAKDAQLELALNLKEKIDPQITQGRKAKTTWKAKEYQDPFLKLKGRLVDGTKFDFVLEEKTSYYGEHFPYRALSGKTKTKLRARKRVCWRGALRLRFKDKRYSLKPSQQAALESCIQLPEGARAKKLTVKDGELAMSAVTATRKFKHKAKMTTNIDGAWKSMPVEQNADMLTHFSAMIFMSLYQGLNGSKSSKS